MLKVFKIIVGTLLTVNFLVFWAIPVAGQGLIWKHFAKNIIMPIYNQIDNSKFMRHIAKEYVYTNPIHSDFFTITVFIVLHSIVCLYAVFSIQFKYGYLPWYVVFIYYCSWVGCGGRVMGGAYALAHKEGHNRSMYKKWIRNSVGNFMENILGVFFGNVPYNFTTSHIFIHHRVDGGVGDTFYLWDLDRSSISDFMLYIYRVTHHMCGYSSLKYFDAQGNKSKYDLLLKGVLYYYGFAFVLLAVTRSFSFVFWIYLQPFFCMSYFLALLNVGFHGFIEFDEKGVSIPCVNASTIVDGDDDYFGEDDHMAHHYNTNVYYRDLPAHQKTKLEEFTKHKASVFQKLSILELSIFIIVKQWDKLAEHYVDYSGKMTKQEISEMLRVRACRLECSHADYEKYLEHPTLEARKALMPNSAPVPDMAEDN